MSGYVYFIKSPAANAVKIGFSRKHPEKRLKACQTGNPDALELLGWCDGSINRERGFHDHFENYRVRGEWYRLEGEFAAFIQSFLNIYWAQMAEGV